MTGKISKVANPDLVLKGNCLSEANVSVGGISKGNYPETKTTGIQVRGGKAQTKGKMARGPMA